MAAAHGNRCFKKWVFRRSHVWNDPVNSRDSHGLAGDGVNAWREAVSRFVSNPYNPYEIAPEPTSPPLGHSDFAYNDRFDWTKEDRGFTAPWILFIGTYWHFRPTFESVEDVLGAINKCNLNKFERAMHRLRDAPFHYDKGYRTLTLGHLEDGVTPDNDLRAWHKSNQRTKYFSKMWDEQCGCK